MTDLDALTRRALGDPPPDPHARDRALVRLRSQISDAQGSVVSARRARSSRLSILAAVGVIVVGVSIVGVASLRRPLAADELTHLAQINHEWLIGRQAPPVRIEEAGVRSGQDLTTGQSFALIVRSLFSRSTNPDGSMDQTQTVVSVEFASEQDRATWEAMGSPKIPHAGQVITDHFEKPLYDLHAISTDPITLERNLRDGSVTGFALNDEQMFDEIGGLLAESELTPDQRAALYHVAASLDGVDVLGDTVDPLGRLGIGFSMAMGGSREVLIFDRNTGQPLAGESLPLDGESGAPWWWRAFHYESAPPSA